MNRPTSREPRSFDDCTSDALTIVGYGLMASSIIAILTLFFIGVYTLSPALAIGIGIVCLLTVVIAGGLWTVDRVRNKFTNGE